MKKPSGSDTGRLFYVQECAQMKTGSGSSWTPNFSSTSSWMALASLATRRRGTAPIDQHQRLLFVDTGTPHGLPFQPQRSISQPAASL
jgi:hypothetical protein